MIKTLRELADENSIYIGAAVNLGLIKTDSSYKNVLQKEFNMVVGENAMKWSVIRPSKDVFDFEKGDKLIEFAQENKMTVRGHTLVWASKMPDWVFETASKENVLKTIEEHIEKVAGHYKGNIYGWDVVNEALDDDGNFADSPLFRLLGPDYVETSLIKARQTDPKAKLFLNEWGADSINKRSDKLYEMVKDFLRRHIPLDGVGFQMHTGLGNPKTTPPLPDIGSVRQNLKRFSDLDLEIHITEMDVQIQSGEGGWEKRLEEEAGFYKNILETALEIPTFKAFVVWGVNDKYSWVSNYLTKTEDAPLLFDKSNNPKPAYFAVHKVLEERAKRNT